MNRLRELRKSKRMTQSDVAKIVGIGQSGYSFWESGRSKIDDASLRKLAGFYGVSVDYLLGEDANPTKLSVKIPVLGDVAAGIPIEAIENIVDYEEIDAALAATGELFGLRIKGSSMEPRIREGDVVIVRKQSDADTGDTAVVLVNGDSATVKRIKKEPDGSLWLIPNNPAYETKHYTPAEVRTTPVSIIGKVVELRGKF
ncbi:MAG: helix-turn-helix domain-containing protein [Clostridiales bacterium]|nr:helix-turn-helix domain-containing protein [Clostridiales bacterium]MDY4037621.1 XRE family transcriptional regulator [Candidatus Pseudoscilispira sp.]